MTYASLGWFGVDLSQSDYPDIKSGGDYEKFNQWNWSKGEVYVYRFEAYPPKQIWPGWYKSWSASMPLVRAFIRSMPQSSRGTDIIAITMKPIGSGELWMQVEIIFKDAGWIHTGGDRAGETLGKMRSFLLDEDLNFELSRPAYAMLGSTASAKKAIPRWLGAPLIWSASKYLQSVGGTSGMGKDEDFSNYTRGFTEFGLDGGGQFAGSALSTMREIGSVAKPPIVPVDGGGDGGGGGGGDQGTDGRGDTKAPPVVVPASLGEPERDMAPWIIGGLAFAAGAAYFMLKKAGDE